MSVALDLLGGLILEDGRRWGEVATSVQRADAEAILDESTATPYGWLGRSRGYSKTTDLAAVALVLLLRQAPAGSRSYAVAADQDQARLLLDSLDGFVYRSPELKRLLDVQASRIVVRAGGASLEALPADAAGAWGLRPWFAIVDELGQWGTTAGPRRIFEAVASAMPKTGGRLIVATTASDPAHWSARVREHALADPLWRVSETSGPAPWIPAALIAEQRRRLPESSYRRLFENEWTSGEDRLVSTEDLAACVVLDGPVEPIAGMGYVVGLDVGLKRDSTVAAVCHLEHSTVTLDRLAVWTGTRLRPVRLGDVEEWVAKAAREYRAEVVLDPWQAAQLTERLRRRGVRVREYVFSAQSVGRLASTLFLLLRERALRLPDDEALLDELANVRLRETSPGTLRMDHDADKHDDRAIALALAAHRLVERGERAPAVMRTYVPRAMIGERSPAGRPLGDVDEALLAARYGAAMGSEPQWFARRRARARASTSSLDVRLGELGIASRDVNAGRAELAELLDRASR